MNNKALVEINRSDSDELRLRKMNSNFRLLANMASKPVIMDIVQDMVSGDSFYATDSGLLIPNNLRSLNKSIQEINNTINDLDDIYVDQSRIRNATAKTHTNYNNDQDDIPNMRFMSYWNGAYNSNNTSNLTYCNRGAFGTIVTANSPLPVANGGTGATGSSSSTTIATYITAASGFTISSINVAAWGKVASIYIVAKRSTAISAGNITNITIGTVKEGYRPKAVTTMVSGDWGPVITGYFNTNGSVTIAATHQQLAANDTFSLGCTYIRA